MRTMVVAVLAGLAIMTAACTDDPPAANPNVPAFTSPPPPPAPSGDKPVPKTCAGLATLAEVTDVLGAAVTGQTLPVVGVPEPKIGRTARIDCYYGVPDGQPVGAAAVHIGLASYTDPAAAQRRMTTTIDTERESGAKATEVPVGPDRGTLLTAAKHTLVAARGTNTIVVIAVPTLVPPDQAGSLLARLADRALTPR